MMILGLSLTPFGHQAGGWRHGRGPRAALEMASLADQVQRAQSACVDFVFLGDGSGARPATVPAAQMVPYEPTMLTAALAASARQIGFVASASTGQHELYNLARRYASLDLISSGRVGWNVIAGGLSHASDAEYVEVVRALWGSWDKDAFVYDKAEGRFFVPEKMHLLNHRGAQFTVRGPLNVNPSPQGKPIIAAAITPKNAAVNRFADLAFVTAASAEERGRVLQQLKQDTAAHRREMRVLSVVRPWIGSTTSVAVAQRDQLKSAANGQLDPELPALELAGTAGEVADALQSLHQDEGFDGFLLQPPLLPEHLDALIEEVVPALRRRRLIHSQYQGSTLRAHLRLPYPSGDVLGQ